MPNNFTTEIQSPFRDCKAHLKTVPSEAEFRGRKYQFINHYYVCDESGIEFFDSGLGGVNMNQIYDQYRRENDIPFVSELVDYMDMNNLSETDMNNALGLPQGTFHRYVLGEVPSLEIGNKLRNLIGR